MGKYPTYNCRQLERRLREIGCVLVRTSGSHRHFSNPFRPNRLITFAYHPGDVSEPEARPEAKLTKEVFEQEITE